MDIFDFNINGELSDENLESLSNFLSRLGRILTNESPTITTSAKPVLIGAPLFVQDTVKDDVVFNDAVSALLNIYCSFILCTLSLNQVISHSSAVKDIISKVVSTESLFFDSDKLADLLLDKKSDLSASKESREVDFRDLGQQMIFGRIISIDIVVPNSKNALPVYFYVRFSTRFLVEQICRNLLSISIVKRIYTRFLEWRAGEISFWKDFLFSRDISKKIYNIVKNDTSGVFSGIINRRIGTFFNKLSILFGNESSNINNCIYIFDEELFNAELTKNGINPKSSKAINKIISNLQGVMILLLNPVYQTGTLHIFGFKNPMVFTYQELAKRSRLGKKGDSDILSIFEMFKSNLI